MKKIYNFFLDISVCFMIIPFFLAGEVEGAIFKTKYIDKIFLTPLAAFAEWIIDKVEIE